MSNKDEPPSEKRVFHPRLIGTREARMLYDMKSVAGDLALCRALFSDIGEKDYVWPHMSMVPLLDKEARASWALVATAIIYYRRCFKSGVRSPLDLDKVMHVFNDEYIELHKKLINIADKHIAHSVNDFEIGSVGVYISVNSDGSVLRGGISSGGQASAPFSMREVQQIVVMIDAIVEHVLVPYMISLEKQVRQHVDNMTDEQLLALPDGLGPPIAGRKPGDRRKWPPPGKH